MSSSFRAASAATYERAMGRWSRRLAPAFIAFAGLADGERVLDVGCGNGSLTFALAEHAVAEIVAVDYAEMFVEETRRLARDPRINVRQADACDLPFEDGGFDRALALLVLHFVPDADKAIAEMRRVVRPGGVVAAAVWDHLGGMPAMRLLVDAAAMLGEDGGRLRDRYCWQPMMQPGELRRAFLAAGLEDVAETQLIVRMDFSDFDDYWAPLAAGISPLGTFITGLDPTARARLEAAVRAAYEAGRPDGPRSFASVAWACRGRV